MSKISEYLEQKDAYERAWEDYQARLVAIEIPPLRNEDGTLLASVIENGRLAFTRPVWPLREVPALIAYLREISEDQPPRAFCNCQANTTSQTSNG